MTEKTDKGGLAVFAGAVVLVFFILGVGIGQLICWKNFKRDQNWIKKEIVRLNSEKGQIDDLIRSLQDMMDEIDRTE